VFAVHLARFREEVARELGCEPAAFETNALTVARKPPQTRSRYVALIMTFGTGTVVSVEDQYVDFVRAIAPVPHYRAFQGAHLMAPLAAHAAERGRELEWRISGLGFLPAAEPPRIETPAGLEIKEVDREWRERFLPGGEFDNALGEPGDKYAGNYWRFGLAAFTADGETAALAGAYDDGDGLLEIGVDVARQFRGQSLGRLVVAAMSRRILEMGMTPTYYCAPTNIRSQRTALSCGFVPVSSGAKVSEKKATGH
jgi:GNAT superfamily N-acetyltransferase